MLRKTKQQLAHTSIIPSLGNRDLKTLQNVIITEKTFIKQNADASQAWHANDEALVAWGEGEGDELSDVLAKLSVLFDHYTSAQDRLSSHLATIRLHFKSIRTREEGLASLKSRKRTLASKIESVERKLQKMGPENKELAKTTSALKEYRSEMQSLTSEVVHEELALSDFKRRTTKEAMGLKCAGLLEFSEKVTIVAEIGKMMIDMIPLDVSAPGVNRPHYSGHARTEQLLAEANRSISDVGFAPSGEAKRAFRKEMSHLHDGTEINDAYDGSQAHEQYDHSGQTDGNHEDEDAYAGGGGSYSAAADYSGTPIYATHQTTQPWLQEADNRSFQSARQDLHTSAGEDPPPNVVHTESLHDQTAEDWARSAEGAAGVRSGPNSQSEHLAQENGVGRIWNHGLEREGRSNDALGVEDRAGAADVRTALSSSRRTSPAPESSQAPPPTSSAAEYSRFGTPTLPPVRVASPIASGRSAINGDAEEDPYFTAVGSTRAIQAAARRPTSPAVPGTPSNRYDGSASASSFAAFADQGTTSPGSRYEPAESGRKMTAAAFRKGFNRAPSASHIATLPPTPSSELPPGASASLRQDSTATSAIEPLAIRKRHSAVHDAEPDDHEIVPPYVAGPSDAPFPGSHREAAPPAPSTQEYATQAPVSNNSGWHDPSYQSFSHYDNTRRPSDPAFKRDSRQSVYGGMQDAGGGGRVRELSRDHAQQSYPQQQQPLQQYSQRDDDSYSTPLYPSYER